MIENDNKDENQEDNEENKYQIEYLGQNYDKKLNTYKIILIGLTGVGKTTISFRVIKGEFIQSNPTISLDLANYQIKVNNKIIQMQLWDTCGNEEFARRTPNLFNNTSLAILVYAINDRSSFDDISIWYNILRERCPGCLVYLIGNKNDLEEKRQVQKNEGEEKKNEYKFNYFIETSSKTGFNIKKLINQMAIYIYEMEDRNEKLRQGKIRLEKEDLEKNNDKNKKKKKKKCC